VLLLLLRVMLCASLRSELRRACAVNSKPSESYEQVLHVPSYA
jgi:hypothetical protein